MGIYLYDTKTGKNIGGPYDSQREAERQQGFYRGYISDITRGKVKGEPKILVSNEKYDTYPGFAPESTQPKTEHKPKQQPGISHISEADLRKKHDMFFMVLSFVQGIPNGEFVEESAMLRHLGIVGKPRYRDAITRPELKDFKGRVDGVIYYGSQNSIKKLKSEGVLQ